MKLHPFIRTALLSAGVFALTHTLSAEEASSNSQDLGLVAQKPLFRDPVFDGAADPVLVYDKQGSRWLMFYTNRRANANGLSGVAWVHGTRIGMAQSVDGGASWHYLGTAAINDGTGVENPTHWAPEIIREGDTYHMFLTVVPGIFEDWKHPRSIVHLTSKDLKSWGSPEEIKLSSDRVIDACVFHLPDGTWRMWYNNEKDKKSIYFADSADLKTWTDKGKAVGDQGGEGPKVFRWKDIYWMITDVWQGLAVYKSEDAVRWQRQQGNLLREPGKGADDQVKGGHADIVVSGDRAFLFYFTHPGKRGADTRADTNEQRRSSIQVVELEYKHGWLTCDRDKATQIKLLPQE